MARAQKNAQPLTTAQRLGSIVKSCRDIMRKDKGLNGDLDRLPMLTWIMFLKFLDDMEQIARGGSAAGRQALPPGHRAALPLARLGGEAGRHHRRRADRLRQQRRSACGPTASKAPGLFAYLRGLQGANGGDRRDVIATVFKGIDQPHDQRLPAARRDQQGQRHPLHRQRRDPHPRPSLRVDAQEMRDAAGDSGEFYTPRPVVRFMVEVIDPRLGEVMLDPACGTGGFLVEAFKHLEKQCKTVEERQILQNAKHLRRRGQAAAVPAGADEPAAARPGVAEDRSAATACASRSREIGDSDRVDVILTNPPFGGEEERGILGNFPDDKQTSETALLFLQLIMRKLQAARRKPGRAAVVVPNGTLFGDGVCARIKEELLKEFNLHTIVRLPNGVFAPYTSIPTNLLFFDRSGPTEEVWYYEQPLPEGRKNYTKTQPIQFEEFADCLEWWQQRAKRTSAPGKFPPRTCWNTIPTDL